MILITRSFLYLVAVCAFYGCTSVKDGKHTNSDELIGQNGDYGTQAAQLANIVTIAAVGDIMLGANGLPILSKYSYDYPFETTKSLLVTADVAIANLEMALTERGEPEKDKPYVFRNKPQLVAPALRKAGLDIVSLANNHSMDFGVTGLEDTIAALEAEGILSHGAGLNQNEARRARVIEVRGQRLGFLAYSNTFPESFWATENTPGTAFGHLAHIKEDVAALVESGADIITVSFHWGRELEPELREYQPLLARAAIDAGADVVIGHHPHILQAVEHYKTGIILYSLGNYTFSSFSNKVAHSAIALITLADGKFKQLELSPLNINNFQVQLQPKVLEGEPAKAVFEQLQVLSGGILSLSDDTIIYSVE